MKIPVDLDKAEAEALALFEAKKAEGSVLESKMRGDREAHQQIVQDMTRLQGAYQAIQNLRKQAEGSPAEADITSPGPSEEKKEGEE